MLAASGGPCHTCFFPGRMFAALALRSFRLSVMQARSSTLARCTKKGGWDAQYVAGLASRDTNIIVTVQFHVALEKPIGCTAFDATCVDEHVDSVVRYDRDADLAIVSPDGETVVGSYSLMPYVYDRTDPAEGDMCATGNFTFYFNVDVRSIYLHDTRRILPDHFVEGEHGWVLQGVVSRASFRRAASSGQAAFNVLSLHTNNVFAKKRGIAKKIIQAVRALLISQNSDLVAGDPGVVAAATISVVLTKYFLTLPCRRRRAPHHCGDPDPSRTIGRMCVVF